MEPPVVTPAPASHASDAWPDAPWDVVVIGAGPAGSVCAHALASAERRVLLVDRATFPRSKVCGCCLAPAGVRALVDAGLADVFDDAGELQRCDVHIGARATTLSVAGFRVIGRDVLDARLLARAQRAGAITLTGHSATVRPDGSVRVRSPVDDSVASVRPKLIVAADGLAGAALSDLPAFAWRIGANARMGVGATLARAPLPLPGGRLLMLADPRGEGYLGLVRLPSGAIDAAAALHPAAVRRAGGLPALCARIVAEAGGDPDALRSARWHGTPTLTRARARIEDGPIFALGDAAGYVEPFTGEGMTWAVRSGALLASVLDARLSELLADAPTLALARPGAWTRLHAQHIAREQRRCAIVARLLRAPRLLGAAARLLSIAPRSAGVLRAALGPAEGSWVNTTRRAPSQLRSAAP